MDGSFHGCIHAVHRHGLLHELQCGVDGHAEGCEPQNTIIIRLGIIDYAHLHQLPDLLGHVGVPTDVLVDVDLPTASALAYAKDDG